MELKEEISLYLSELSKLGWETDEIFVLNSLNESELSDIPIDSKQTKREVAKFLECINGTKDRGKTIDEIQIFPGYYPLSAVEVRELRKIFRSRESPYCDLIPLFADGMDSYYCLNMNEKHRLNWVFEAQKGYSPEPVFSSLAKLFTTYRIAIELQIVFLEDEKYLEMNDVRFSNLAEEMNPDVEFWKMKG